MKRLVLIFSLLFVFCSFLYNDNRLYADNQLKTDHQSEISTADTLSLIFAGDIMGHSPQFKAAYNPQTNTFNYNICFENVKHYIDSADYAFCNLEVPIAGKPYKGYPNFSSPDELIDGLKYAGYDVIQTANNHVVDCGKRGLERTIRIIESRNLKHMGSYINKAQRDSIYPLILEKKGVKIAFLNCTYGTNDIPTRFPNIVNYIDTIQIKNDLLKAKRENADLIVMTVHWGVENQLKSNAFQRTYARFFVRNGVNLIIGSHPHVVQNAEIQYGKDSIPVPVYYSVGNSISNQRDVNTNGGIMVKVNIDCKTKKIITTSYIPVYVYRGVLNSVYQYHLIPTTDYIKDPSRFPIGIKDSTALMYFNNETCKRLFNMEILM